VTLLHPSISDLYREKVGAVNVAGMLRLAQNDKRPSETDDLLDQTLLFPGAGFEPF
jgi:hypothetical protein